MNLKRQMKHDLTVYAHILNSALGVEERNQNWAAFCKKWSAETDLQLAETDDIQKADFIFLATGGVEHLYTSHFLAGRAIPSAIYAPEGSNAFASMSEIRGFLKLRGLSALCYDASALSLREFAVIARSRRLLAQSHVVMWGETAPWLVASTPDSAHLGAFATRVSHQDWGVLNWQHHEMDSDVESVWAEMPSEGVCAQHLENACRLSSALKAWCMANDVDAVSVGCFPLLAQCVSACLAVSDLLDAGYPAACENDLCSAMAMLVADILELNTPPAWMANLVNICGQQIWVQHCTIARSCLCSKKLMTHFESNANVAVAGALQTEMPVTVFRFDEGFKNACIAEGTVVESGPNDEGCRTAAVIELSAPLSCVLGNHHIVLSGHHGRNLRAFCQMMGMKLV